MQQFQNHSVCTPTEASGSPYYIPLSLIPVKARSGVMAVMCIEKSLQNVIVVISMCGIVRREPYHR